MELPFKYMVLCIIKKLNERNMPLVINKVSLIDYFSEFIRKSDFTTDEKKEIVDNFDFNYELDDLCNKYYKYFDVDSEKIIFDEEYALDIDNLILEEKSEYDDVYIYDINFVIEGSTSFLDIIGVKIRKDLYNYLSDLERDIENCYNEMSDCYNYSISQEVSTDSIVSRIKKLMIIKTVMLLNTKNLLTKYEYCDLIGYANTVTDNEDYIDDTTLLLKDEDFDMSDIMHDVFLRSIFMGSDSYAYNLRDRLIINMFELDNNIKFSIIKFYLTFLELLDKEIGTYNVVLDMEFVRIKYRIINTMDSVYGTTLFLGNNSVIIDRNEFREIYAFIEDTVFYFIKEILMYDDERYRNDDYSMDNTLIYLNNIIKKLLIETYYKLTGSEKIVDAIKSNPLYGVNRISSDFLRKIIDKPRSRVKGK